MHSGRTYPPYRCRRVAIFDGPLAHLARGVWRLALQFVAALARLLTGAARLLADARSRDHGTLCVLAQLANRKRATLVERTLRDAVARHCRSFAFDLTEPLIVVVRETVDAAGELAGSLEREELPDGSTRHVLEIALAPNPSRLPVSLDALLAELGRQLIQLQRTQEGIRVAGHDVLAPAGGWPPFDGRPRGLTPFPTRNGHDSADPLGRAPEPA